MFRLIACLFETLDRPFKVLMAREAEAEDGIHLASCRAIRTASHASEEIRANAKQG